MSSKLRIWLTILTALVVAGGGMAIAGYKVTHEKDKPASSSSTAAGGSSSGAALRYVALGDSVAAGIGLEHDSDSSACDRTNQSYPHQLADQQHYTLTNLACSQATLTAGINGVQDVNHLQTAPQVQQLFAQNPAPNVITLTVGANDAGWSRFITSCYAGNCNAPAGTAAFSQQLGPIEAAYKQTLKSIVDHYSATSATAMPRIVVTDYYHVYPAAAISCADTAGVDAGEQGWVRQQVMLLNDTIRRAASSFGDKVTFVQIDYTGHELCTSNAWVQGINEPQPFHPTADGQAAIAKQIATALNSGQPK